MRSPGDSGGDSSGEWILRLKKSDGPIIAFLPQDAPDVGRAPGVLATRSAPPRLNGGDGATRLRLADSWPESDTSLPQKTLAMVTPEPLDIDVEVIDLGRIEGAFIGTLMLLHVHR